MNKETLIANKNVIIIFILVLVLGLGWIFSSTSFPSRDKGQVSAEAAAKRSANLQKRAEKLEQKRRRVIARINVLEKMSQKEWDAEGVALGEKASSRPATREQALKLNKARLAKMTADIQALKNAQTNNAKSETSGAKNKKAVAEEDDFSDDSIANDEE